jgi:hypothetical protein
MNKSAFVALSLFCGSCEAVPVAEVMANYTPSSSKISAYESGELGIAAIAIKVANPSICAQMIVVMRNNDNERIYRRRIETKQTIERGKVEIGEVPLLVAVEPGQIEITAVRCEGVAGALVTAPSFGFDKEDLPNWLLPFEVKSGEVVYPGTIVETELREVFGKEKVGSGLFAYHIDNASVLNVYEIEDRSEQIREHVAGMLPEQSADFVFRPITPRLDATIAVDFFEKTFGAASRLDAVSEDELRENQTRARNEFQRLWTEYLAVMNEKVEL